MGLPLWVVAHPAYSSNIVCLHLREWGAAPVACPDLAYYSLDVFERLRARLKESRAVPTL